LSAARIVKVISGERRAPIRQHTNEFAAREIGLHVAFDQVGQAETLQCGLKQGARTIEDKLPVHADFDVASVPLELPRVETSAVGG
jgi:hypothetical protein